VIAITRGVARTIQDAQLTHIDWQRIDYAMAATQHREYCDLLASLGCEVVSLPADDAYPDCVFIEDTAIVLDDMAVITRPGAESRRGETRAVADALEPYRPLVRIEAPATIDGGDVLVLDDRIYVGLSTRTNEAAIGQLRYHTRREVIPVTVTGILHLKSAVTRVAKDTLLINREFIDASIFDGWKLIDTVEPLGANALLINDVVIYPVELVKTRAALEAAGLDVRTVGQSELAKAEGGVTCCSLLFADRRRPGGFHEKA
jgi:dimethylargininase